MPEALDRNAIPPSNPTPNRSRVLAIAFALLTVLAVGMTYPQIRHMRTAVPDVGDPLLNVWALAWVAHQAPIAPARLFDGNIFYPERWTLAYSEPMIVPALAAAPLLWMSAGPVLVYNIILLSAIVVSGVGATLLVLELTGDAIAAVVAGVIFAFLPFRFDHYSHFQLQQTAFIPLTMWALHRVVNRGRLTDGVRLGACAGGQFLSCVYFGVFLAPYLAAAALVLLIARARVRKNVADLTVAFDLPWMRRTAVAIGIAAVTYAVVVAPVARAHLRASAVVGERHRAEAMGGSAVPLNYLSPSPSSYLYASLAERFGQPERNLFPGFLTILLAALALRRPWSSSTIAYVVAALVAFDLSLGFNGFTYQALWTFVTPFRGIRVPARMGLFTGFSLAVLAGFGLARLNAGIRSAVVKSVLAVTVAAVVLLESASKLPLGFVEVSANPPPIYDALLLERGHAPTSAIVELPFHAAPTYMYYSTFHWQNLLNGYSGFFPPSYDELRSTLNTFPDETSLAYLLRRGTRFVIVHGELMAGHEYAALVTSADRHPGMRLIAKTPWQGRELALYRLLADR